MSALVVTAYPRRPPPTGLVNSQRLGAAEGEPGLINNPQRGVAEGEPDADKRTKLLSENIV